MNRMTVHLAGLVVLMLVCGLLALSVGTSEFNFCDVFAPTPLMLQVRLPRVLLGAIAGGALATAGAVLQAVLQNPLADPYVVGVSGGAALGGVLALACGLAGPLSVPLWAFGGAMGSLLLLLGLARWAGRSDPLTLLLAGTIFNAIGAAAVTFVKLVVDAHRGQEILFWLMGAIGVESYPILLALAGYTAAACSVLLLGCGAINLLALGDTEASALGLPVALWRLGLLAAAALLVASTVAFVGMVGFVGLIVPHLVRPLVGANHRHLLPSCFAAGACMLMLCDTLARLSFYLWSTEVPAGAITACCGGPFFLAMLFKRRGGMGLA